ASSPMHPIVVHRIRRSAPAPARAPGTGSPMMAGMRVSGGSLRPIERPRGWPELAIRLPRRPRPAQPGNLIEPGIRYRAGNFGLIGNEAFLVGLFPLPAQGVGARGDPGVGVLRVGDVCGLGAFQEPDVLPVDACRSEERSARLPGEQPVLV